MTTTLDEKVLQRMRELEGTFNTGSIPQPKPSRKKTNSYPSSQEVFGKLHAIYQDIDKLGYFISTAGDLQFNITDEIRYDEAKTQVLTIAKENYSAASVFTILTCLLHDSSMILFGDPGSGKTTLAEHISSAIFNLPLKTIQQATLYGHPELTEEKMIGMFDIFKMLKGEKELIVRESFKLPVWIIDEVNRIPASKLSILYQLTDRGFASYMNELIMANSWTLFATANAKDSGNFDLPIPFLDRFNIGLAMEELDTFHYGQFADSRVKKIKNIQEKQTHVSRNITEEDIVVARKTMHNVIFPDYLMSKLAHFSAELRTCDMAGISPEQKRKSVALFNKPPSLCERCDHYKTDENICSQTTNGISPRSIASIYAYSKALAAWRGNTQVTEDDLKKVLAYSTWFKLGQTRKAEEKDPRFINDRLAWVENMYDTSSETFNEVISIIPAYQNITRVVQAFELYRQGQIKEQPFTKSQVKNLMGELKRIDSIAKYPLGVALRKMYLNLK